MMPGAAQRKFVVAPASAPHARGIAGRASAFAFAALLAAASAARALPGPDVGLAAGHTFAVLGIPNAGGFSGRLSAVWPLEKRFAFGAELSADDLGAEVGQLVDENGNERGATQLSQRSTYGAAWRMEAYLPRVRHATPYALGEWGLYRISDSHIGEPIDHLGSTGYTLGGGLRWPVGVGHAVGFHVRYVRLINDVAGRFMSAGVDWTWRTGSNADDARAAESAR
jgi:hypothetical protein